MEDIEQGDFIIEIVYNTQSNYVNYFFTIDDNGDAIGFWGGDFGETYCDYTMQRTVRLKFNQLNKW